MFRIYRQCRLWSHDHAEEYWAVVTLGNTALQWPQWKLQPYQPEMVEVFDIKNVGSISLGKDTKFQRRLSLCCSYEGVEKKQQHMELKNIIHDF